MLGSFDASLYSQRGICVAAKSCA